jgi:hypothetical protein
MAGHLDPLSAPSATDTTLAHGTDIAQFAARTYGYRAGSSLDRQRSVARLADFCDAVRTFFGVPSPSLPRAMRAAAMPRVRRFDGAELSYVAHPFAGRPADAVAIIDVQEGAGSQQQARHATWAQLRTEAMNSQAKSPRKISTTIASPRGTS